MLAGTLCRALLSQRDSLPLIVARQPCLHHVPCLGSASSCQRRLPVGSSLYSLKPALRARFLLLLLLRLCLCGKPPKACSLVGYPCAITGMHAHATTYMHACTHSDDSACSSRPGANLDCITCPGCLDSSSALQRRLLLAAHSTRGCSLCRVVALTR